MNGDSPLRGSLSPPPGLTNIQALSNIMGGLQWKKIIYEYIPISDNHVFIKKFGGDNFFFLDFIIIVNGKK